MFRTFVSVVLLGGSQVATGAHLRAHAASEALSETESGSGMAEMMQYWKPNTNIGPTLALDFNLTETGGVAPGDAFGHVGKSKLAVVSLLLQDPTAPLGKDHEYPLWAVHVLGTTARHARKHDHTYVLRRLLTLPAPVHMTGKRSPKMLIRENANWEKFQTVLDQLETGKFSNVMVLDADATFFNQSSDTMQNLADQMNAKDAAVLIADEDWCGKTGSRNTNGGMMMFSNNTYARTLLKALIAAHMDPRGTGWHCWGNEQQCIRAFRSDTIGKKDFPMDNGAKNNREAHVLVVSGMQYNRHPCALPEALGGKDGRCQRDLLPAERKAAQEEQNRNRALPVKERNLAKNASAEHWWGFKANSSLPLEIVHFMGGGKPRNDSIIWESMLK